MSELPAREVGLAEMIPFYFWLPCTEKVPPQLSGCEPAAQDRN